MLRDPGIHGRSRRGDIHARIGAEILERTLRSELAAMVQAGKAGFDRGSLGGCRGQDRRGAEAAT